MAQSFDPASIPRFAVIRIPYSYDNDPPVLKLFVVIDHITDGFGGQFAFCLKATSNKEWYNSDPRRKNGAVYFAAGEVPCFPSETFVQPENPAPIPHQQILQAYRNGDLTVHAALPVDFEAKLCAAIRSSIMLSQRHRDRFTEVLDCTQYLTKPGTQI